MGQTLVFMSISRTVKGGDSQGRFAELDPFEETQNAGQDSLTLLQIFRSAVELNEVLTNIYQDHVSQNQIRDFMGYTLVFMSISRTVKGGDSQGCFAELDPFEETQNAGQDSMTILQIFRSAIELIN